MDAGFHHQSRSEFRFSHPDCSLRVDVAEGSLDSLPPPLSLCVSQSLLNLSDTRSVSRGYRDPESCHRHRELVFLNHRANFTTSCSTVHFLGDPTVIDRSFPASRSFLRHLRTRDEAEAQFHTHVPSACYPPLPLTICMCGMETLKFCARFACQTRRTLVKNMHPRLP